jgi:type IV pilus assembly protein PilY1
LIRAFFAARQLILNLRNIVMQKLLGLSFMSRMKIALFALLLTAAAGSPAATTLSNDPLYSASNVPANLMLALSVEFPTATVAAYKGTTDYTATPASYLGYFDNSKCYDYDSTNKYFVPVNTNGPSCAGNYWSGNMLNWATMSGIDEFRQALTGGNRSVDAVGTTVLLRSNLTAQGSYGTNFPDKTIGTTVNVNPTTVVGDPNMQSFSTVYLRSGGKGTTFQISNSSSFPSGCPLTKKGVPSGNCTDTFNAAVQVCLKSVGLELNCNSNTANTYIGSGTYDKPEGLIQQNYTKIRVGASAYTFINGNTGPNGAVRALVHDNGPTAYAGNGPRSDNTTNSEWSSTTGIFQKNPYPTDAKGAAPGGGDATDTGAINYLNKFGSNANYETYDTVADLYWATLAYFMQVPLDSTYTKNLTATNSLDPTFPVFSGTPPNDPISYSCQSNAIVTIGDDHTHYDTSVPSSGTLSSVGGGPLTPIPANGTVPAVDAYASTTAVGNFPLIEGTTPATKSYSQYISASTPPSLGGVTWQDKATYYIAGLAYFAHTSDIRNDITSDTTAASLATLGKQTIDTYAVDVLEPGSYDGTASNPIYNPASNGNAGPSIYWLAAKYGGFNDINGDGKPANFLTWHTNTTTALGQDLRPDNYFFANQPDVLQTGLQQIFNKVSSTSVQRGAGPTVTPTRVLTSITANTLPYSSNVSGFPIYNVQYKPVTWDGDVSAFVASTVAGSGVTPITGGYTWDAQSQLETLSQSTYLLTKGWDTGRRIITWNGTAGVPFRYLSLSGSEKTALNSDANLLNFLRGDKTYEQTVYRGRAHILGDIVDSQAVLVQGPSSPAYTETANPGYTAFSATINSATSPRQPVIYVGANDGMMHAFAGDFSQPTSANPVTGGGSELFAYVPSLLYNGPNGTPKVDGLSALANLSGSTSSAYNSTFAHHFYVDRTPQVSDVDFQFTGLNPKPSIVGSPSIPPQWRSLLVGGLGKGGKGFYALDVTSVPSAIDTSSSSNATTGESVLASKALWEYTEADMGYSYGRPLIAKTRKYGWVVILTSGYNNISSSSLSGHGILYILNAKTGALIQKIDTGVGSSSNPAGLGQATGFTQDVSDGTIDQVYAGDLLGNVWRFDLSETALDTSGNATPAYPAPIKFATLTDASGNAQPITTAPRIELSVDSTGLGTLRYVFVGTGQFLDTTDLNNSQKQTMYFLRDGTGPAPSTSNLPLTRSSLTANTNLTVPLTGVTDGSAGSYYDLTGTAGSSGGTERIVVDPDAAAGVTVVTWATVTPSTNPCSLGGAIYAVDFTTGQSVLQDSAGNVMPSITTTSAATGVQVVQLPDGSYSIIYGTTGALPQTAKIKQPTSTNLLQQTNWREIID